MKFWLYMATAALLWGCKEDIQTIGPKEMAKGKEYFPLEVGHEAIFQATKITHKELAPDDTLRYQLRQLIASVEEGADYDTYRMELYVRPNATGRWELDSAWSIRSESQKLILQESNVPYLKAVFPLYKGSLWDGNAYNRLGRKQYMVEAIDESYLLKGKTYDSALQILQSNAKSLLHKDARREVYAAGKGLIYKKTEAYQYINDSQNSFYGKDSIIGGTFYELVRIN